MVPYVWNGPYGNDLFFIVEGNELEAPIPQKVPTQDTNTSPLVGLVAIPVAITVLLAIVVFVILRKRKTAPKKPKEGFELDNISKTKLEGVKLGGRIGAGNFGTVYEGTWKNTRG
jgi:hypothetical protein